MHNNKIIIKKKQANKQDLFFLPTINNNSVLCYTKLLYFVKYFERCSSSVLDILVFWFPLARAPSRFFKSELGVSHFLLDSTESSSPNVQRIHKECLTNLLPYAIFIKQMIRRIQKSSRLCQTSPLMSFFVFGFNQVKFLRNIHPLLFKVAEIPKFPKNRLSPVVLEFFKTAQSTRL
uniref:Uncharacterized protein n=1 Tax=Cacopsylla melanoneura TaxID=428564 RepID=A0A8D8ZJ74_9HEMI